MGGFANTPSEPGGGSRRDDLTPHAPGVGERTLVEQPPMVSSLPAGASVSTNSTRHNLVIGADVPFAWCEPAERTDAAAGTLGTRSGLAALLGPAPGIENMMRPSSATHPQCTSRSSPLPGVHGDA
jgi:hypothetical protein